MPAKKKNTAAKSPKALQFGKRAARTAKTDEEYESVPPEQYEPEDVAPEQPDPDEPLPWEPGYVDPDASDATPYSESEPVADYVIVDEDGTEHAHAPSVEHGVVTEPEPTNGKPKKEKKAKPAKDDDAPAVESAVVTRDDSNELPLNDEKRVELPALAFTSGDERRMTALALGAFVADLKGLAKKSTELGRHVDARGILRDAALVNDSLLSQLESQLRLSFNDSGSLLDALTHTVGARVRSQLGRKLSENEAKTFEKAFESIASLTARAVLPIIHDLSERAFDAGRKASTLSPEYLAKQAVYSASTQDE